MCGRFYLNTMHANRANLIMRYFSIQWSDSKTGNTVATVRISRLFLWYVMNELMHVMQRQNDACDARMTFFWYMDGHSSHLPWLNHGCKIECLQLYMTGPCMLGRCNHFYIGSFIHWQVWSKILHKNKYIERKSRTKIKI